MKLLSNNIGLVERKSLNSPEDRLADVLKSFEYFLRVIGTTLKDGMSACESVGLNAPPPIKFTRDDLMEMEFDTDGYIAKHIADDADDADQNPQPKFSYERYFKDKIKQLNIEQSKFVREVSHAAYTHHLYKGETPKSTFREPEQKLHLIVGDGGTGKTDTVKVDIIR